MPTETQPANAAAIKSLLNEKVSRREAINAELSPLREKLSKLRTDAQYGRGNSLDLPNVKSRVQQLEGEQAQLNREIADLDQQYRHLDKWESGEAQAEMRQEMRNYF